MGEHHGNNDAVLVSPAFNPLAAGDEGDVRPSSEQVSAIVSILSNAGICCCFVQEFALVYYGTRRVPSVCVHLLRLCAMFLTRCQ